MAPRSTLSNAEARRVALAAQGFANAPSIGSRRPFDAALARLHVLQIDSVNVFSRSHYMPVFSRHGVYDRERFDRLLWSSGEYTEYWAHEAAFISVEDRPLFAWRMDDFCERYRRDGAWDELGPVFDRVRGLLRDRGPSLVRELETERRSSRGPWWDWSETKRAVEILFATGEVTTVGRERFERRYALTETVLPERGAPPARATAQRILVEQAARSLGVATLADLADYHRLKTAEARPAVRDLEAAGVLVPVTVEGWSTPSGVPLPAWLHRDARVPRSLRPNALLTPFDPLCWFRPRAERLFDFHYRIEIYTPAEKRRYGYYCLPLLVDGQLAGRIDLKADRGAGSLLVQAAWQEENAPPHTGEAAAALLQDAAHWQGLDRVTVSGVGNLPLPAVDGIAASLPGAG